jgi:hypothetical protein
VWLKITPYPMSGLLSLLQNRSQLEGGKLATPEVGLAELTAKSRSTRN